MSATRPTVAVIGGGYGGVVAAKGLDDVADVVLVEPKDAFLHNAASLRALARPEWIERLFFPYDRLLAQGRVVRDRAVAVHPGRVELASGETLAADYVVIATGSSYPFPAKSDIDEHALARERYRAAHEALAQAERVLLVGAGPVGLELAGEIRAAWPDKRIVVADLADDVLAGPFAPALRTELRRQLAELRIELLLGSPLAALPLSAAGELETFTVATERGEQVTADVWFRCHGVRVESSSAAGELAQARTATGQLSVTPELRVAGQETVFALGDVADADVQMARTAMAQGKLVAANVRAAIEGGELTPYEPSPPGIFLPLGPDGGAGQMPGSDEVSGADVVAEIKGRDLFMADFAGLFGLEAAEVAA